MPENYSLDPTRRRSSIGVFLRKVNVQLHGKGQHTLAVPFDFRNVFLVASVLLILPLFLSKWTIAFVGILCSVAAVFVDFFLIWEPVWDFKTAFRQYLVTRLFYVVGMYQSWRYHRDSQQIRKTQEQSLMSFIKANRGTDYARDHKFDTIKSASDFIRTQPLTKFADLKPYVDRMAKGEQNVLTNDPPLFFAKTSGTTGSPAFLPFTKSQRNQQLATIALFTFNADRQIPWSNLHRNRPIWKISYIAPKVLESTPSGVLIGPMTANPMWTKNGEIYTAPTVTFEIDDSVAGGYVNLLFTLRYRQLGAIEGIFASLVYYAFKKMEAEWRDLVKDIRNGTIKEGLDIAPHIRAQLLAQLTPDPARADELEDEFRKGFDNIARRIWPELEIVNCITTGAFQTYARYLKEHYIQDILMYPAAYGASENLIGANFWPHVQPSRYTLLPRVNFYEFIPVENSAEANPETLMIDQVKVGQEYELVITTVAGLYRYRLGDVVKIVSYYNQCPVVEFLYRSGAVLNIRAEKLSELSVYSALCEAAKKMAPKISRVVEYSACESVLLDLVGFSDNRPGSHHTIFVELLTPADVDQQSIMEDYLEEYEKVILRDSYKYAELRSTNSLAKSVIIPVKPGAFGRMREYLLKTTNISAVQLKIPHVLLKPELLQFLIKERLYK